MALSMDEQRILDEIERRLSSADPRLAIRMASFGVPGHSFAVRMRRLRLLASFSTLLIVAVVSLVVYAVMPFRSAAERHSGSKSSASPPQSVQMAPSGAARQPSSSARAASPAASAASGIPAAQQPPVRPSATAGQSGRPAAHPAQRASRPQ
jgi:predicted lipid-binding transport protein (Tim44 family)